MGQNGLAKVRIKKAAGRYYHDSAHCSLPLSYFAIFTLFFSRTALYDFQACLSEENITSLVLLFPVYYQDAQIEITCIPGGAFSIKLSRLTQRETDFD
jgi:hypothetical protein